MTTPLFRIALALVCLLPSACVRGHADTHMDVVYDPCSGLVVVPSTTSNEAELASIDEAFELWSAVLSQVALSRTETPEFEHVALTFADAPEALRGVYDDEKGIVYINERLVDSRARAITVAHELGHAFGLWHVQGRDSVMNPGNMKVPPTSEDAASVRDLWPTCGARSPEGGK